MARFAGQDRRFGHILHQIDLIEANKVRGPVQRLTLLALQAVQGQAWVCGDRLCSLGTPLGAGARYCAPAPRLLPCREASRLLPQSRREVPRHIRHVAWPLQRGAQAMTAEATGRLLGLTCHTRSRCESSRRAGTPCLAPGGGRLEGTTILCRHPHASKHDLIGGTCKADALARVPHFFGPLFLASTTKPQDPK